MVRLLLCLMCSLALVVGSGCATGTYTRTHEIAATGDTVTIQVKVYRMLSKTAIGNLDVVSDNVTMNLSDYAGSTDSKAMSVVLRAVFSAYGIPLPRGSE